MRFEYPVNFEEDNDEVIVRFPDLPEVITSGYSIEDALKEAEDALEEAIAARINHNEEIPVPSKGGLDRVSVPLQMAMKAALYNCVKNKGLKKTELASLLKCDEKVVRRILDPKYNTPLKKLEEVFHLLKIDMVVESHSRQQENKTMF